MISFRFIFLAALSLALLAACANKTQDPALQPRNSVQITPENLHALIMNVLAVFRAHGELPIKVADLSVTSVDGSLVIRPSSDKLLCEGNGFSDESSTISGIGGKSNAFAYSFTDCKAEVIDADNYNMLTGRVIMKDIVGSSGACDDFSGEFSYKDMQLHKIRNALAAYNLTQINGSFSFDHLTHDDDRDGICEKYSTTITGDSFAFIMEDEQVEESLFVSRDEFNAVTGTYAISLDSYINSDSMNGRYKLVTRKPLVGLRDNVYPLSGKFDLVGTGVSGVTVEILSNVYDDLQAVKLDLDIDPPDGIPDTGKSVYISWCELEKGPACELLQEAPP